MKHKQFDFRTAYIDLLLNVLTGIIFLFLMTTMLIQAKKQDEGVKRDAQFIINATWDQNIDCDVDLWVQDPNGNAVWFNRKDLDIMHLERDDMGFKNDYIMDKIGRIIGRVSGNGETWVLRGIMPGEFYVSVHAYSCRYATNGFVPMPVGAPIDLPVKVELIKVNPTFTTVKTETVTLTKIWEELTAFNFTLDADGNVTNIDNIQHRLVRVKE